MPLRAAIDVTMMLLSMAPLLIDMPYMPPSLPDGVDDIAIICFHACHYCFLPPLRHTLIYATP